MTDENVIDFPQAPKAFRNRHQLAAYLRKLADLIENDRLEHEPFAIATVLTSNEIHECLHVNHGDKQSLRSASDAFNTYAYSARSGKGENKLPVYDFL